MLDVHPPHEAAHTWRDFLIHIATIVIGLLIAIGLEQTVEYFHRRHQVHELREALRQEREENRKIFLVNVAQYRVNRAILENDLRIFEYLRQHPGTPEEKLPGVVSWAIPYQATVTAAWRRRSSCFHARKTKTTRSSMTCSTRASKRRIGLPCLLFRWGTTPSPTQIHRTSPRRR